MGLKAELEEAYACGLMLGTSSYPYQNIYFSKPKDDVYVLDKYLDIEEEVVGVPGLILKIGPACFKDNTHLKKVIIGRGITTIGANAFENCSALEEVELPDTIALIDRGAFKNCKRLKKFSQSGQKLLELDKNVFEDCAELEEVKLNRVSDIGDEVFKNCTSLDKVDITGNGSTTLGNKTFENCKDMQVARLANFGKIGSECFKGCSNLETLKLTNSLKQVDSLATEDCKHLKSIYFEDSKPENNYHITLYGGNLPFSDADWYGWSNVTNSYFIYKRLERQ